MQNVLQNMNSKWKEKTMKAKKSDYLQKIYEKNTSTGNYVIQVAIR